MDASLPTRIDIDLLIRNMGGNDKIIPKLFEVFWESCDHCIKALDKALLAKDLKAWKASAHELKGAALSVTAKRIAGLCEEAGQIHDMKHKDATSLLYHLNKEIAMLRQEAARLLG